MLLDEVEHPQYDAREIALFEHKVYYYGRYLDPETRTYALQNAVSNLSTAVEYLSMGPVNSRRLLDLGCGLGMQSILFALMGWEVLGIDVDPNCIAICRKRKSYYEARLGRELKLQFAVVDFRKADTSSLGPKYDALFSMSALAYIKPLTGTVAKLSEMLNESSRVVLWDRNPSYLYLDAFGLRHKSIPRPWDVRDEFGRHGFNAELFRGACAIPRQFWRSGDGAVSRLNSIMKRSLRLSFSYLLGASRGYPA